MAKSAVRNLSLLSALLLGAATFTVAGITGAAAKVGVTSATDGDPLGKPPIEAERVLRVGIDVQANEIITTKADDRAHLVFLDGTSLTVGPDANLVIDKFVYDPNTKTGDLAITASKGVFRLVGGKISKTNAIAVTTPSSTIGIRGGIGMFDVSSKETKSFFIFGTSMTIAANGRVETITRPGSWATTLFGGGPGAARLYTAGDMDKVLKNFDGKDKGGNKSDADGKSAGFSKANSGKGPDGGGTRSFDKFGSGPGPSNRNPSDTIVTALTQANQASQPQTQTTPKTEDVVNTTNQMTSTITYKGGMTGLVNNNGQFSIKNGTYQNAWNVGQRMGAVTATFDGATYGNGSLNTKVVGNGPAFITPTPLPSVSGPARSLSLAGTFTGSGGVPTSQASPGNQVGVFAITGSNYGAAGVFNGKKQ